MKDKFDRQINYLRISVTDRCNLRCVYCMPHDGVPLVSHDEVLSLEEIAEVARFAAAKGVNKVRLTGGEPLLRRNIQALVKMLADVKEITDLAITTNGVLLAGHAQPLADAGLHRVNVSLDTTDPVRYKEITRGGDIDDVIAGIDAARAAGLAPIKINCVVTESSSESDAREISRFARENGLEARFIRRMDSAKGHFSVVEGGTGGDCAQCNRLRLSSTGVVRPCLFSDLGYSVRELGAEKAIELAVANKPKAGGPVKKNWIRAVGG